jgi:chemotaxis protein CheZ
MAVHHTLVDLYGPLVERLTQAMLADRSEEFHSVLESIKDERADDVTRELRVLAETLHDAMLKFRHEFRVADLTEREVPDARTRLEHVMTLTDEAAHRTMDLIEQCVPLAERTSRGAMHVATLLHDARAEARVPPDEALLDRVSDHLTSANNDCLALRSNLTEVMLAQSYQDLTGQIIRGVIRLVGEVETVLAHLMRMTGATGRQQKQSAAPDGSQGFGPAIPGVSQNTVSGQQDVDDLIANLGI